MLLIGAGAGYFLMPEKVVTKDNFIYKDVIVEKVVYKNITKEVPVIVTNTIYTNKCVCSNADSQPRKEMTAIQKASIAKQYKNEPTACAKAHNRSAC